MKILILGGTGAMGIDLVKILAQATNKKGKFSHNIIVTSRSPRESKYENVSYIQGNACDNIFLQDLLQEHYDAIVDFMVYTTEEFRQRYNLFLDSTSQYIFLSSSKVYADSKNPLTETSPRLLDTVDDNTFLDSDDYPIAKARQENLLTSSGKKNYTIVRPYITYSNQRLQLGIYEKEDWLYLALQGKTIPFSKSIAEKYTTMTLGKDVAYVISTLIGNKKALGNIFQITSNEAMKWKDILDIYKSVFQKVMGGKELKIQYMDDRNDFGYKYKATYDRLYNRIFSSNKLEETINQKYQYTSVKKGLEECFKEFLANPKFINVPFQRIAQMNKVTKEKICVSEIPSTMSKIKYLTYRYLPNNIMTVWSKIKYLAHRYLPNNIITKLKSLKFFK